MGDGKLLKGGPARQSLPRWKQSLDGSLEWLSPAQLTNCLTL